SPTSHDWVGVFPIGAGDGAYIDWFYTSSCQKAPGAPASQGSCPQTMTSAGTFELRLYANKSYTRLATSQQVTVTAGGGGPTLSVRPTSIGVGGTVTATWGGVASPTAHDWVGVYPIGAGDGGYIDWFYTSSCQKAPGARASQGSCTQNRTSAGIFELRLYANGSYTRLATSQQVTVTAGGGGPTLSVRPTSIGVGGTVTATWGGVASPTAHD